MPHRAPRGGFNNEKISDYARFFLATILPRPNDCLPVAAVGRGGGWGALAHFSISGILTTQDYWKFSKNMAKISEMRKSQRLSSE